MKSSTPLDYAVFQLSPRHSRCELFVSSNGSTEKLASGLVKPFVSHLKVAEEQISQAVNSIKLDVEKNRNAGNWFTKGTLEKPEVLESVNTFDAEMSQLEAAWKIYSQGGKEQPFGASGGNGASMVAGADATKKELLRAIDVRLSAVRQDLTTAFANASAAGFNPDAASDLRLFSDHFRAHRLNEACTKFISLCERRPELITSWKPGVDDQLVRASWGSDMSIDDPSGEPSGSHQASQEHQLKDSKPNQNHINQSKDPNFNPHSTIPQQSTAQNEVKEEEKKKQEESTIEPLPIQSSQSSRRLSVQDRINLFENKQKENSGGKPAVMAKPAELRRLSSDVSSSGTAAERAVLKRWSGASDMSIDLGNDKKDNNGIDSSPLVTPSSSSVPQIKSNAFSGDDKDQLGISDTASSVKVEVRSVKSSGVNDQAGFEGKLTGNFDNDQAMFQAQTGSFGNRADTRDQPSNNSRVGGSQSHTRSISGQFEGSFGMKLREVSYKESDSTDQPSSQPLWRSVSGEIEQVGKNAAVSAKEPTRAGHVEIPKRNLKMQGRKDDSFGIVQASSSAEQGQRVRQSKGNQELNDELKLKANELEKLFVEHKLRVPREDQSSSSRRSKATESQVEQTIGSQYKKPVAAVEVVINASDNAKFSTPPPMKVDHQSFTELSLSDESRGKFYEKYMQKREAKLKEEWGTKRAEKEAKLKAMQDNLEWSRAELKAKFSGSHNRAEKLRLFHSRSGIKRGQNLVDNFQSEGDKDSEFSEQKYYRQEDGASRSSQGKKMFQNRNTSTSTSTSTTPRPVPRSSAKISNPISGRRRVSENPLAQSVPNFSDFRKENTKPSSGISKTANRAIAKPYSRSRSGTNQEAPLVKEEKPRHSHSLRKSLASPAEFEDSPPLNSNDVVFAPLPTSADVIKNEEFEESPFEAEDSVNVANEEAEEEEDDENGKPRLSQESDSVISLSQVDPSSVAELAGESPVSWNSRLHNPFSYPHEISDIDASVDSPMGSPASWNSHSLSQQTDADSARMRKKWGSAQKPFLVANSSQNQPRKEVTKGFKRLLKFGRKSRGSESLVDWISATTSEGDDDVEDGRDPASRLSEDLRKSRMGFNESELFHEQVQAIHSSIPAPPANFRLRDDHMSGSSIKAPKSSFFSLSTFRSKGSESKLR